MKKKKLWFLVGLVAVIAAVVIKVKKDLDIKL
jgi:uncharacterized membrane protein